MPRHNLSIGNAYAQGEGVRKGLTSKAATRYRRANVHGNADAQSNLGWLDEHGHGVRKSYFASGSLVP